MLECYECSTLNESFALSLVISQHLINTKISLRFCHFKVF